MPPRVVPVSVPGLPTSQVSGINVARGLPPLRKNRSQNRERLERDMLEAGPSGVVEPVRLS